MVKKYSPRTLRPNKFCVVCNKQMRKINEYFCCVQCYTKFRLGLGVDYTKIVCRYPRKTAAGTQQTEHYVKPNGIGQINYSKFNYCRGCKIKIPKSNTGISRCPDCNQKLRQKPVNILRNIIARDGEDTRIRI